MDENTGGVATQERPAQEQGRSGRDWYRSRWVRVAAVVLVGVLALVWAGSAQAVSPSKGITTWGPAKVGRPFHIGEAGMVDRDLEVLWVRPRIVGDADVEVRVCRREGHHRGGAIGTIRGNGFLAEACAQLEPLQRGTVLPAAVPEGSSLDYVLVTMTPHSADHNVAYCGLDIAYRSGARFGFTRGAGHMYTVLYTDGRSPRKPDELC